MKRNVFLATLAVVLFTAVPAWAAPPFGSFGGKVGGGNAGSGPLPLHGWALDDDGVAAVDVLVNGIVSGRATYGRSRPAVLQNFPSFPDAPAAGWVFQLDTTRYLNGRHTVSVRVRSRSGEVANIGSKVFQFNNVTHNLAPFGRIEFPLEDAELTGTCTPGGRRRYSVVAGWALDAGVNLDDTGIGYVELMIDRALWSNTRLDCNFIPALGGSTDCYGIRRVDIARDFPSIRDSIHSGFRFVLDTGALIGAGLYNPGHHVLTIRAGDLFGTVRNIAEIPVIFNCAEELTEELAIGFIDVPANGLLYSGLIQVSGWALDFQGIDTITILVDGHVRTVTSGPNLPRPAVSSLYPGYPESATPAYRIPLDTTTLSNGEHKLQVIIEDDLNNLTFIGERTFTVRNPRP